MIARVLSAALVAGFLAACVASVLQAAWTTPLILKAETFEKRAADENVRSLIILAHGSDHGSAQPSHEAEGDAWKPADGWQRVAFTSLATLVSGVGYALVLLALMLAAGAAVTVETGLRWALGGFLAVSLAPALGLPPELPGMGGGHLALRQAWWVLAAVGTGLGLYLVTHIRSRAAVALGLAAMALPHFIGAPHATPVGDVPASLAAQFATRSLAIALLFWATLGAALGWAWARQSATAPTAQTA